MNYFNSYYFEDIYIFYKTKNGYINLSDFEPSDTDFYNIELQGDIIIGLVNGKHKIIADITLSELLILADIKEETHFIKQCKCGIDEETAEFFIALLASKKIINYFNGRIKLENPKNITYSFCRRKMVSKTNRKFVPVLKKSFKVGNWNVKETL